MVHAMYGDQLDFKQKSAVTFTILERTVLDFSQNISKIPRIPNFSFFPSRLMELNTLKNVKNDWNAKVAFYLETSVGQSTNLHINIFDFFSVT